SDKREVGDEGFWTVSTCKQDHGIEMLRDDNLNTYWESDYHFPPHSQLSFYVQYPPDDTYTPYKVSFRFGNSIHDLTEFRLGEYNEPKGWQHVPLYHTPNQYLKARVLQMLILENYQNGKNSHIRQIKIF
ncbi:galactose-binding domain-like protein, partial [Paraphysoderma sedebokerense]